jgi:glucan-binding YG repeat protein
MLADIDGDRKADLVIWRASTGTWYWLTSSTEYSYSAAGIRQFGNRSLGDVPLIGDIDGDSRADLLVWRAPSGTWYWLTSSGGYSPTRAGVRQWGAQHDVPVLIDADGDQVLDLTIWRPSNGYWYWLTSRSSLSYATAGSQPWGNAGLGDIPVVK